MSDKLDELVIEVNRGQAKSGAWVVGTITLVGIFLLTYIAIFGRNDTDGPIVLFLCAVLFGWMFLCFINMTLWLIKLSRFTGPILAISETGIIDFWENPPRELPWESIKYTKWQTYQSIFVTLIIMPKKRSWKEIIGNWLGKQTLRYPRQYFTIPDHKIAKFMIKYAPEEILK